MEINLKISKKEIITIIIFCIILFITRIPWIFNGYGTEPDAYRVVNVARVLAETGTYNESRLPGFPLYEYLIAFTPAKYNPVFSNTMSAIFSCIAFLFFVLILKLFSVKHSALLSFALMMIPVIYINSVQTMDYILAMAMFLGSMYFVLKRKVLIAGIFLGLAVGFRITSGAFILPLVFWIFFADGQSTQKCFKSGFLLVLTTLFTSGLLYLPLIAKYGFGFLTTSALYSDGTYNFAPTVYENLSRISINVWGSFGVLGLMIALVVLLLQYKSVQKKIKLPENRNIFIYCILVFILYIIAYIIIPNKSAYLIPIIPFALMLLGLLLPKRIIIVFSILLIISPFITISRKNIFSKGLLIEHYFKKIENEKYISKIIDYSEKLPANSVIVVGWYLPQLISRIPSKDVTEKFIYDLYKSSSIEIIERNNIDVYFLPDAEGFINFNAIKFKLNRIDVK